MSRAENRLKNFQNSVFQTKPWNDKCINQSTYKNFGKIVNSETKLALSLGRKNK